LYPAIKERRTEAERKLEISVRFKRASGFPTAIRRVDTQKDQWHFVIARRKQESPGKASAGVLYAMCFLFALELFPPAPVHGLQN